MSLITVKNLNDQDGAYAALIAAHHGLSAAQSAAFNARMVLILANHIGERRVIDQALALAKATGQP
jgi:plasmid stability protein